ncbi:MAG TPA: hypothetical protein VFT65_19890, partial [Candidatus Angelobacter sp.]|nr:hypothetical protein [Candidatus Angelobacter sp.]
FVGAIGLRLLGVFVSSTFTAVSFAVAGLLVLLALVDLFSVVRKTQQYNVATAGTIADGSAGRTL